MKAVNAALRLKNGKPPKDELADGLEPALYTYLCTKVVAIEKSMEPGAARDLAVLGTVKLVTERCEQVEQALIAAQAEIARHKRYIKETL